MWYYLVVGGWGLGFLAGASMAWSVLDLFPQGLGAPVVFLFCALLAFGIAIEGGAGDLVPPAESQAITEYLARHHFSRATAIVVGAVSGLVTAAGAVAAWWVIEFRISWWLLAVVAINLVGVAVGFAAFVTIATAGRGRQEAEPGAEPDPATRVDLQ